MADNYLEKRYEELFGGRGGAAPSRKAPEGVETLLHRTRSHRAYDKSYEVMELQLEALVRAASLVPSARNQQVLRFKLLTRRSGSEKMQGLYRLGGALPELHLPAPGTEPEAFIVVCSTVPETRYVDIDLGIACEAMVLKASELGLQSVIICAFDKSEVRETFDLPFEPLAVIAVGKGTDRIVIDPVGEGADLKYFREDGIHHVPKIRPEELIIR